MRQSLTITILALLALGSFWLLHDLEESLAPNEADKQTHEIAVAYQVLGRYFAADNQLKYRIRSESVHEFSHAAGTSIHLPVVQVFEQQRLGWQGRADTALLSADKKNLSLNGDVRISESSTRTDPLHVSSDSMVYDDDKRYIFGHAPVKIANKTMQQTADGFTLDINRQTVHFKTKVHAIYTPIVSQ